MPSFNWIRVRGVVTATSDEDDSALAVQHNIRVFAQVEGPEKQAIATQGDLNSGFNTREDACESGCLAACERATTSAAAEGALEKCQRACHDACIMPDASGKFSAVVYGSGSGAQGGEGGERRSGERLSSRDGNGGGGGDGSAFSPGGARPGMGTPGSRAASFGGARGWRAPDDPP
jgi:hypothetical protein